MIDVTAKIERVFILIRRSRWMFRRFLLHKAIGDKGLLLILPKPSICPRLLLGTFVGNVMITSSAPIRRWPWPRWSRRTPVVGRLRPPSKKCVLTWDWRRREDGRRRPCCGWRPACLGCSRWSRCCTTCCRWRADRGPGGMAGQGRDDLLRCHHGGKALAVGELGFCKPWVRRGLFKTLTPIPGGLAFSLGAACVTVERGQKTS